MQWFGWLALLGASQGFTLALAILAVPHGNHRANFVLSVFLSVISLRLVVLAYYYQSAIDLGIDLYHLQHVSYALGPLLYYYVRFLVQPRLRFHWTQLLHLLPVIIAIPLYSPGIGVYPAEMAHYLNFDDLPNELKERATVAMIPLFLSLGVYSALSLRYLNFHGEVIRSQFSSLERISLRWLSILVYLCLATAVISAIVEMLRGSLLAEYGSRVVTTILMLVATIYYIGLMGLRQRLILVRTPDNRQSTDHDTTSERCDDSIDLVHTQAQRASKYRKSGLSEDDIERIWLKLSALMEQEDLFCRSGLTLSDVATKVNSRPHYVSQVINERSGQNFYDYVNGFRIKAAQVLLEKGGERRYSIAEVAHEVGFGSLNVFNRHFKRLLGMTPSAYRKKCGQRA